MSPHLEILLIEDDEIDSQLVEELIALRGRGRVRVTGASRFKAAIELLRIRTFDLVLLDTRLPDVSALSALRSVGEAAPDTPILAHTPFLTAPLRQKARAAGPFDVAIRGDLDSMWLAISGILGVGTGRAVPAA